MASDVDHLTRYSQTRDAEAFQALVGTYQGFVYSVCLRILGNAADAEDAAQECFLALARKAGTVNVSVAGWLHRHATQHCVNRVRGDAARARREREYGEMKISENDGDTRETTWREVAPQIDRAVDDLPDELRHALIEHFLRQRSQSDIAEEVGASAATLSRRVRAGVEEVRKALRRAGVAVPAALLGTLLWENSVHAAPAGLAAALGKMAIAGVGESVAATTAGAVGTGLPAAKVTLIATAVAAVVAVGTVTFWHYSSTEAPEHRAGSSASEPPDSRAELPVQPGEPARASDGALPGAEPAATDPLQRKIDVSYRDARLRDVLADLRAKAGLRSAYVKGNERGFTFSLRAKRVSVKEVLDGVCAAGGLTYDSRGGVVLLWNVFEQEVLRNRKVSADFNGTPLREALRFLAVTKGIDIRIDPRLNEWEANTSIGGLTVANITVYRLLKKWILRTVELDFVLRGRSVVVTRPELADAELPENIGASLALTTAVRSDRRVLKLLDASLALTDEQVRLGIARAVARISREKATRLPRSAATPREEERGIAEFLEYVIRERDREVHVSVRILASYARKVADEEKAESVMRLAHRAFSQTDDAAREDAFAELSSRCGKKTVAVWRKGLTHRFGAARKWAVNALGLMEAEVAVRYLEQVLSYPDFMVRRIAVSLLPSVGGEKALELARKALADEDSLVRGGAVCAILRMAGEEALPLAGKALRDPDWSVRGAAQEGLGGIGGEHAFALIEASLNDENEWVRGAAVSALGHVGGDRAFALIRKAQADEHAWVRGRAARSLVGIGTDEALALLETSMKDRDEEVPRDALNSLTDRRSARALLAVLQVVDAKDSPVHRRAWYRQFLEHLNGELGLEFARKTLAGRDESGAREDTF